MIVKTESTLNFIGNWSTGIESFAIDTPNAVLVVDESEKQDTPIIELFNPIYDLEKKKLKYEITPDNTKSIELQSEFEFVTLVIDIEGTSYKGQYIDIDNFGAINVKFR